MTAETRRTCSAEGVAITYLTRGATLALANMIGTVDEVVLTSQRGLAPLTRSLEVLQSDAHRIRARVARQEFDVCPWEGVPEFRSHRRGSMVDVQWTCPACGTDHDEQYDADDDIPTS